MHMHLPPTGCHDGGNCIGGQLCLLASQPFKPRNPWAGSGIALHKLKDLDDDHQVKPNFCLQKM